MGSRGRYRLAAISGLAREWGFSPEAVRRRVIVRAERLVESIEAPREYPYEFVVYRLSGYRPQHGGALLAGEHLLHDLPLLVLELSRSIAAAAASSPEDLSLDQAALRAGVSRRTIHRWRREGLCFRSVALPGGGGSVRCDRTLLDRFLARRGVALPQRPRRIDTREAAAIRAAFAARLEAGEAPTPAAAAVAAAFGRSREAIRQACRDRAGRSPKRPAGDLQRLLLRAARHLIAPEAVAGRLGRAGEAASRSLREARSRALGRLELPRRWFPTFDRAEADSVLRAAPIACDRLAEAWIDPSDLDRLLGIGPHESGRAAAPLDAAAACTEAEALLATEAWLVNGAAGAIATLPVRPREALLDAIETDLRWATRLRQRAVGQVLPLVVARIEQLLASPLRSRTVPEIARLLDRGLRIVARQMDRFGEISDAPPVREPRRRRRPAPSLQGVLTLALDRALAGEAVALPVRRAAARHPSGAMRVDALRLTVAPWAAEIDGPSRWRRLRGRLDPEAAALLSARWGWGDAPPSTVAALAAQRGLAAPRLRGRLRAAGDALRAVAWGGGATQPHPLLREQPRRQRGGVDR